MSIFVIIPFICFVSIFLIFFEQSKKANASASAREAFLFSAVTFGALIVLITEVLSIFKALTFAWVLGMWSAIAVLLLFRLYFIHRRTGFLFRETPPAGKAQVLPVLLPGSIAFIAIVSAVTALMAPPNNWDSMVYHMSRIPYWIQNKGVSYYPVNQLGFLWPNPFAEWSILQFQLLSGGDRFANMPQWLSMAGCLVAVPLIAKQLGANTPGQILASFLCATVPIGILQAPGTQNNYVLAFWLASFVYFALTLMRGEGRLLHLLACGASLGLAILTKSYAYFYALPFCVWFFFAVPKNRFRYIFVIGALALLINLGYFARNFDLFASPLGDSSGAKNYLLNETFSARAFISNVVRNAALHVGTGVSFLNGIMGGGVKFVHGLLGMDMSDPRITFPGMKFYIPASPYDENITPNTAHFWLFMFAILLLPFVNSLKKNAWLRGYLLCSVCAFLLFCLFIRWQVHNTRLHLPLFVLFSAFAGTVFSAVRSAGFTLFLAIILVWTSFPRLFFSKPRPWFGKYSLFTAPRNDQYFVERRWLEPHVSAVTGLIRASGCRDVGMYYERPEWEYPFWVFLNQGSGPQVRFRHVNVDNVSFKKADPAYFAFNPCAVIAVFNKDKAASAGTETFSVNGRTYDRKMVAGPFQVFLRTDRA